MSINNLSKSETNTKVFNHAKR